MTQATHIFLIRNFNGKKQICLAMKKRGFGEGKWNAVGGKMTDADKSIEQTAVREAKEEIGVDIKISDIEKFAEHYFTFSYNQDWGQVVHTYLVHVWKGDPNETEEMSPKWFDFDSIPYREMWVDDIFWLPLVLEGKKIKTKFEFGPNDIIISKNIEIVQGY